MNHFVLLSLLALSVASSSYLAEAKGLNLDEVVRALDALYKRQSSDSPGSSTTSGYAQTTDGYDSSTGSGSSSYGYGTTYGYGSGTYGSGTYGSGSYGSGSYGSGSYGSGSSGGDSGSGCWGNWGIMYMIQEVKDRMFMQNLREVTGSFNGICMDVFDWLYVHTAEYDAATDSTGEDSSFYDGLKKRSSKMEGIKRNLRGMMKKMEGRSGEIDSSEYTDEEDLNDEDIMWRRLFVSCYVWLHLSGQDMYYYKK